MDISCLINLLQVVKSFLFGKQKEEILLQPQFHRKENGYIVLVKTCEDIVIKLFIPLFFHAPFVWVHDQ
jgi:hypothetical protein